MRMLEQPILITSADLDRLRPVLDTYELASESLEAELQRATVIDPAEVPSDLVTMNSEVIYEDCDRSTRRRVRIVYPKDADPARGHVSVLAPIGSALLGLRANQSIEWRVPGGTKRIRVVEVTYQPEAAGDLTR